MDVRLAYVIGQNLIDTDGIGLVEEEIAAAPLIQSATVGAAQIVTTALGGAEDKG